MSKFLIAAAATALLFGIWWEKRDDCDQRILRIENGVLTIESDKSLQYCTVGDIIALSHDGHLYCTKSGDVTKTEPAWAECSSGVFVKERPAERR